MDVSYFGKLYDECDLAAVTEIARDIWPDVAKMQDQAPVIEGEGGIFPQLPGVPNLYFVQGDQPSFLVLRFDPANEVLRNHQVFSSAGNPGFELVFGKSMVTSDPPAHTRYRSLVQARFGLRRMDSWATDYIAPVVDRVLTELRRQTRADLVRDFAFPIPYMDMAGVLGFDDETVQTFTRVAAQWSSSFLKPMAAFEAAGTLKELSIRLVEERRQNPGTDIVSELLEESLDGEQLTDDEVIDFLRLLGVASLDTTWRAMSVLLTGLLTNPDQLDLLRRRPELAAQAVEEGQRWESVSSFLHRTCVEDTTLEGVHIPAGSAIIVFAWAANRDPARWEEPDRFRVDREPKPQLSFGGGIHTCVGIHLARRTIQHDVMRLIEEFPALRIDADQPAPEIGGWIRQASAVPVRLD